MRTSNQIIILLTIILLGVLGGGYLVVEQLKTLRDDAFAINNLGVIRGSIQLITKRELNGTSSQTQIEKIDLIFLKIKQGYLNNEANLAYVDQFEIDQKIRVLEEQWQGLKQLYTLNREDKGYSLDIMENSEQCWELADELVYGVQTISEIKLTSYRNQIIVILSVISVFIVLIIAIVYRIIRNRLEFDAISDSLTGLYNRNYFNKVLSDQLALFQRYGENFTLTLLDIDFFKKVNDDFGHPEGDRVLLSVSALLKANTRDVDYLFRLGGEEFAVISPHCDLDSAVKLAEKYRTLMSQADFNIDRSLTVSIGISQSCAGCAVDSLYKNADVALYQAKSTGRNRVISFAG